MIANVHPWIGPDICISYFLFHLTFAFFTSLKIAAWSAKTCKKFIIHHHHKHQGVDPLIRSVSKVTAVLANVFIIYTQNQSHYTCVLM